MATLNVKLEKLKTHEGATAKRINEFDQLKRSVLACLLWENSFYESGVSIADRVASLVPQCDPDSVASLAKYARSDMNLRHMPLWITRVMARTNSHKHLVKEVLGNIIQRPDELNEFMSIYWKDGKQPLSAQVKKGLAHAITKFGEYQLAKYNRDKEIKLRDVLFMCHAKPKDDAQAELWKRLINDTLATPDTWEVKTSAKGVDQKEEWTRLLVNKKLGALALLKNLRNLTKHGVDEDLIRKSLSEIRPDRVLPYRFISAAKYAPHLEDSLETGMLRCLASHEKMPGKTVLLIDVSGSMNWQISDRSEINRIDAANGLAMLLREICSDIAIYTFSEKLVRIPPRRGFALRDAIIGSQPHGGTLLGTSIKAIYANGEVKSKIGGWEKRTFIGQGLSPDRLIVISDEQSHDTVGDPKGRGYMINIAAYKNGVGYGPWIHCDGWSTAVVSWIQALEKENLC